MPRNGLVVSVAQDRRAGERQGLLKRIRRDRKSIGIPTDAVGAGWQSYGSGGGPLYRTGPRRLAQLATAYGGTNDSVTWVFACVTKIASEAASYPWHFADLLDQAIEAPPEDLHRLLIKPNDRQTYFDFAETTLTDLELVGNCYWLKDRRNGIGQPAALQHFAPELVRIAVSTDGRVMGYVYSHPGGTQIPYDVDEIMHFRYPNPLDEYYGMGTVEAIARAIDQEIAQSLHVTGFFQNGARISGVLSVPTTLTETQFQRIKHQFVEEFAGPANAWKVLVAEGEQGDRPDFQPITQAPNTLGVVDLRKLSKDEILTGFGVPEFLLGGAAQAGVYKMEEAQHIFQRRMIPAVTRYSERITIDLATRWGDVKFVVEPHANEPLSVKLEHASKALQAGASVDEARAMWGGPAIDSPASRAPLVPANHITLDQLYQRPVQAVPVPLPSGGTVPATPTLPVAPEPSQLPSPEQEAEETEEQQPEQDNRAGTPTVKDWRVPVLPPGYEARKRTKGTRVPDTVYQAIAEHQAAVLVQGTPIMQRGMVAFFKAQRDRVMDRLAEYGPTTRRARGGRLKAAPGKAKDELTPDALWNQQTETAALNEAYLPLVDAVGGLALTQPPEAMGVTVAWNVQHPEIAKARAALAQKVTRVNDTTRQAIAGSVEEGMRRGYSVVQIATGVPAENYTGILGVFDAAVHDRAEVIARSETAMAYNAASIAGYRDAGVELVEIMDGTEFDEACSEADGQIWTVDAFDANMIEHPNCTRAGAPVTDPNATADE